MAHLGGGKRKRVDRTWSGDSSHDGLRPSPYRPGNLNLAQYPQGPHSPYGRETQDIRGRGGRRPSRGGRGAFQTQNAVNGAASVRSPDQRPSSPANVVLETPSDAAKAPDIPVASPKPLAPNSPMPDTRSGHSVFDYTYLTDEICASWDSTGRQVTLEIGMRAKEEGDGLLLNSLFQEVVHAALSNRLPASKAGELVKETIGDGDVTMLDDANPPGGPSIPQAAFLDALSIITDGRSGLSAAALQSLVFSTDISPDILRQELEASLLESLGLIRSTFARMGIRKQTNILYRQANFNLMREESEGFAKLMTELFTTSNNEPPTSEIVEETVERVKAMIGAFDLDVGRTLDVVLDVFGAVLVKQFRFFVKFLRASPWWPRDGLSGKDGDDFQHLGGLPQWALPSSSAWYLNDDQKDEMARQREERDQQFWLRARDVGIQAFYELGRQRVADKEGSILTSSATTEQADGEDLTKEWIRRTGTTPPPGNRDAAQLLGFKLRFYSSSDARTEHDVLPENLIYLSALLIKVGFISLKDLYPHIWRTDEGMEELRKEKFKEKAEKERAARPGANAKNALLMAGALVDDTLPLPPRLRETNTRASTPAKDADAEQSKSTPKDGKNVLPEPIDQKVLLLQSLLAIGALPDALFILGRFPWLLEIYPDLTEYVHRILHHSLSQVYASIRPLSSRPSLQEQRPSSETDVPGLPKGQVKLVDAPARKTLRWALLDRDDTGLDGLDYRFYWDEWSDNVPLCQTVDDVFILCETFLNLGGSKIGQDTALLSKFARIGKHSLADDKSESNRSRWFDLCKRLLIPALSFTKSNAGVVNEVFEVLNAFPLHMRYMVYLEWSSGHTSRSPDTKFVFEVAKAETRDVLKRISKTNLRPMARALAKIAYANPHIVITTALNQIEVYDSIADTFVEGARYFTDLGYDILTWALISSMARAGRSRVQEGGIFTSKWLAALASFTGKIFRRYNFMRPGPVLQYVANQLGKGNSRDLVVLEQVILSMAGITTDTNYNDAQIQAMGGGELLQSQTILQLHDRRHESRLTSKRLMRSLRDTGLTGKLLISLAQRRQACVFDSENKDTNLKVLGNTFDELHRVMVQYLDLLRSNLSLDELQSIIPDVVQLLLDYGLSPEVAFWISRPIIAQRMVEADRDDSEKKRVEGDIVKELSNSDIEMADQLNGAAEEDGEAVDTEATPENAATPTAAEISGTALNSEVSDLPTEPTPAEGGAKLVKWHPVLQEIMDAVRPKLPPEILDIVGVGFYVTFWQLSLYDITIPGKAYEDELSRQHKKMASISADRTDISVAGTRRKDNEKKHISDLVDRLLKENRDHLKTFAESKARLQREKDQWFAGMSRRYGQLNSALMEYCFLPRILNSPLDSFFCFKFVKLLHSSGTPNFRTLGFYDLIFRVERLTSLIFSCTSKESDNLGRFLNEVLRDLARWHKEKTLYEREAYGSKRSLPGFTMQLDSEGRPITFLSYEDYRRILYRWHGVVFSALQNCLSSAEYMHIRNAISVLRAISQHFPAINFHGTALQKTINSLNTSDMADIVVSSKALVGMLARQEKLWVLPASFRKGQDKPTNGERDGSHDNTTTQAAPETAGARGSKSAAVAPVNVDETADPKIQRTKNAEDGEVDDTESKDVAPKHPETAGTASNTDVRSEIENGSSKIQATSETMVESPQPAAEAQGASSGKPLPTEGGGPATPASSSTLPKVVVPQSEDATKASPLQPASIPKRPDSIRTTPGAPSVRPSPNLPNKPERPDPRNVRLDARFPSRPTLPGDGSREPRDMRSQDYSRRGDLMERNLPGPLDRAGGYGPRGHEYTASDRQPDRGDLNRGLERNYPARNNVDDRPARPPTREHGPPMWDAERSARARPPAESPRVSSERPMQPPANQARPLSESVVVNPERAVLINGGLESRPGLAVRGQGDERSSRGSRPTSPKRVDDRRPPHRSERPENDPAALDRLPGRHNPGLRPRPDNSAATSPRDQRLDRPSSSSNDYARELRHQPPQPAAIDMNHGRLNQDPPYPPRQPDVLSERPPPAADIPSGPRSRTSTIGSRGRNPPPPPPHVNTQQQPPQPSLASAPNASGRQTPTGPSSRVHTRNNSYHDQQSITAPIPAPTTPSADTTGVHPDRLKHIQPSPNDGHPPRPAPFSAKPPPSPTQPSPPSVPSGPRGNAPSGAPSGPSPTTRGPPSGPQFANDGAMRGPRSNRHPLAAVNNTLAQAGQGTSIRGRGGMRNSGPPTPHSGPPTPTLGPGQEVRSEVSFPPQPNNGRPDLFTNWGTDPNGAGPSASHLSASHLYNQRAPNQRLPGQRDEVAPSRPPPSGRRGDLMDEPTHGGRTSSRHSTSRNDTPDRDGGRRSERDDGHRDRDVMRSDRDAGRERDRDRDRDGGRDRRSEGGDRHRESSSRRDNPSTAPPRRSGRGRDSGPDVQPTSLPPAPPMHGQDERRGPGPTDGLRRGGDSRSYDSREDTGRGSGGSRDDEVPPRKHLRGDEGAPYGRGGGARTASESKRPRRGL